MQIPPIRQEWCLSGEEGSIVQLRRQKEVMLPSAPDSPKRWKKPPFVESSDNVDVKIFHASISSFIEQRQKLLCFVQFSKASQPALSF